MQFGLYTIEVVADEDDNSKFELYQEDNEIALENLKTDKLYIKGQEKTENKNNSNLKNLEDIAINLSKKG